MRVPSLPREKVGNMAGEWVVLGSLIVFVIVIVALILLARAIAVVREWERVPVCAGARSARSGARGSS